MRVISGTAKGRTLKAAPGEGTRPITDRVKESLFNILGADIRDARFLDLFAGTGGVGIEALSRGAKEAVFVEQGRAALETIRANLALTKLAERPASCAQTCSRFCLARPKFLTSTSRRRNGPVGTDAAIDASLRGFRRLVSSSASSGRIEPLQQELALVDERKYGSTLVFLRAVQE
jgi:hypothetical protein